MERDKLVYETLDQILKKHDLEMSSEDEKRTKERLRERMKKRIRRCR